MKKHILTTIVLFVGVALFAAPTSTYYSAANNKSSEALRSALFNIIKGHTVISYSNLEEYYPDIDDDGTGHVWDMYSTCTFTFSQANCSQKNVCDCWNKEHSVPQSYFNEATPMKSDLFHVYPTDARVNNFRSNYPYGETSSTAYVASNSHSLGALGSSNRSGYSGTVYEPDDEYKGDFARTYFYMVTRYMTTDFTKSANGQVSFTYSNGTAQLTSYALALFLKWHREDPVSQKELDRNDAVYAVQKNRNPFIDYPCLVEYIWGEHKGENADFSQLMSAYDASYAASDKTGCGCSITQPTITYPKNASTFNVGAANLNVTTSKDLTIKGVLLTKNVTLSISGTNASFFSVSSSSLLPTENGVMVAVSYKPTTTGSHQATLTIASSEADNVTITLTGTCTTELISPSANPLVFVAENVGDNLTQNLLVKGTNLTAPIYLSISGTGNSYYTLSDISVSAAEAMVGKTITLSYNPTIIGSHTATLAVSSIDFSTVNVPISGSCTFSALPASNITDNSFIANWTNAGVSNYTLDVYKKTTTDGGENLLFEEYFSDKELNSANATTSGSIYWDNDTSLRLGTGSSKGSVSFSNNDLSKGGRVVVRARYYGSDSGATLKVTIGATVKTLNLTSKYADYAINVPASASNASATVELASAGGSSMRVWVADVKVYATSTITTTTSIPGYPKSVGNVVAYLVENVTPMTEAYYYAVTPTGYSVSDEIPVIENFNPSAIENVSLSSLSYRVGNVWHISGIYQGSILRLITASGLVLETSVSTDSEVRFDLPWRGIYLLQIERGGYRQTLKMAY